MVAESAFGVSGYRFVFDPTRPGSVHARDAVNDVLQRAAGRTDPVATTDLAVTEPGSRYIDFLVPGLIGMGLMAGGIWGVGFAIVDMRIRQVLKRFLGTPMKKSHFVAAMMFSRMVFMIPEIIIVPLTPLISALRHVMQEGASVLQILPELSLITIWGAVAFVVAIRVFRWECLPIRHTARDCIHGSGGIRPCECGQDPDWSRGSCSLHRSHLQFLPGHRHRWRSAGDGRPTILHRME